MDITASEKEKSKKKIKDIKLNALLEITKAINNNFSTQQLLSSFEHILKNDLNIGKLILYRYDNEWKRLLKYGVADKYNDLNVEKELLHIKEISTVNFASKSINQSFEIVIPVFHKSQALAYVLIGDLEDRVEVSPAIKHLPFVQTLTNIIIVAIENKKLAKESVKQAAVKKELELASEMQSMLFPSKLPNDNELEVGAVYLPHQQVGGDYYDFIKLNENEVVFCMADVSGKGVSAALLMANFQANLRAILNHTSSLTDIVRDLNNKVMLNAKGEKYITLFIAKYNIVTRVLTYINAAHNPPLLLMGKTISLLKIGCTGLGMFDELKKVHEGIVNIQPNSLITVYTDGLVELENEKNKEFGVEQLQEIVIKSQRKKVAELNKIIMQNISTFKGKKPYIDDIAILTSRFF